MAGINMCSSSWLLNMQWKLMSETGIILINWFVGLLDNLLDFQFTSLELVLSTMAVVKRHPALYYGADYICISFGITDRI